MGYRGEKTEEGSPARKAPNWKRRIRRDTMTTPENKKRTDSSITLRASSERDWSKRETSTPGLLQRQNHGGNSLEGSKKECPEEGKFKGPFIMFCP